MNITFDLETLGTSSHAPIVQIGAVKFHDHGTITDKFIRTIDLSTLTHYGFKIDYPTLEWWFSQEDKAIKSVFCDPNRVSIQTALEDLCIWIGNPSKYYYWSHATFDPPILNSAFTVVGLKNPIPFRSQRDIRTLTHFAGKINIDREGIHHNALDDCIYQAEYISKGLELIKSQK